MGMIFTGKNKKPVKMVMRPRFLGAGNIFENAYPGTNCGSCGK